MNKKKFIKLIMLVVVVILSNILIFKYCNLEDTDITLSYKLTADKQDIYQLFYANGTDWTEEQSQSINYEKVNKQETLKYAIPKETTEVRFDLGNQSANINISDVKLSYWGKSINLNSEQILDKNNQIQIEKMEEVNNSFDVVTIGEDPHITYKLDSNEIVDLLNYKHILNNVLKSIFCIIIDLLAFVILEKSRSVLMVIQELNNNKRLIWNLSKNDFKTKYAGSYLGIIWAFIQPIVTILVYWFVFQFGLRAGSPIKDVPFILWFMTGLIPWFFFQDALLNATNCMLEYSYLVKKVVFKISILPIVKIISALFVHLVFIGFLFFVCFIYGFYPSQYTIQLIYYSVCTFFIALALSYATSAIVVFFRDLGQIINIFLQIGMWMTPIMWSYTIMPEKYQWILKMNPLYYIVEGYRDTFINHVWFFERYFQTVYFWIITLGLFIIGAMIFKKLKPHFADVL
jgi:teichoic acid transport system permease protein